ncbi:DUF6089 family protein [Tamlana sp. 2_MG-2023]|uniref:type IX secretion system protein PorG n=1 Tax=unclassified Tamlana TaxID=2614803 RepID=UPI0026E1F405|nr:MULTISPECIES: DUF6089 family protein [unclassified Tamlana]MDO6761009.1 DUF6089 family protein [Tamlana sp. 2_MG-2023]MDO6791658.1 DUF6089 family protein [Tamlana sp. 1_MG-2023]
MRHLTLLIISILSIQFGQAQIHEIGAFAGGSNLIGDIGATDYIAPNAPALGLLYRWNRSSRYSWRASIIYSDLKAYDSESDDPRRIQRDYDFDSNLLEISAGMEFTFIDFDLHSGEKVWTPYIYTGISSARHENYYYLNGSQTSEGESSWAFGIPIALGIKARIIGNFVIGVEVGARYTFSDEIDGSMPKSDAIKPQYQIGNINNNDWYMFSGFTLTYTFGENPCYCVK